MEIRPYRSVLYVPGNRVKALEKARQLPVDMIIFDLEDAVLPAAKETARMAVQAALSQGGYGPRQCFVRINGLDSPWGAEDAAIINALACDGIVVPKVGNSEDIARVAALVPDLPIWAMIETPQGVLEVADIARHPQVAGIVMGANDLAKELRARSRAAMNATWQHCLVAARAAGVVAIDSVYNAFRDEAGFAAECREGRDMGFDGKSLIHPAQVATANAVFGPCDEEIEVARRHIAAYEAAQRAGEGIAVVDGRIVEHLHLETARATLAMQDAIAELEAT